MNLRPMEMSDADFMLELKNYLETRQFAIKSQDKIKLVDHLKWLEKHIIFFQVIETDNNRRIGAVRIFGGEISIWIDKDFWGLGVASQIITKVCEAGMFAKIVDGNVGSFRAFIKAGFKPVAHESNYYILQK